MIRVKVRDRKDDRPLQLYWSDPTTGRRKTRSAGTRDWRQAEREAAKIESRLSIGRPVGQISWDAFRARLVDEHLVTLALRSRHGFRTALNHFEKIVGHPISLSLVNASVLSQFQSELRNRNLSEQSIANYLRHVKAALGWAKRIGLIDAVPIIHIPRQAKAKRRLARARAIQAREVVNLMQAADQILGDPHAATWRQFIKGLWWSGLRMGEAIKLAWYEYPVCLDLDRSRYPQIRWLAEGQKRKRDEVMPLTPDFAAFLQKIPASQRTGKVFKLSHPGRTVTYKVAINLMTELGRLSSVKTAPDKHATAHDLRRAFGTRWAKVLPPLELKKLMRHSSIETTMAYYVDLDADDLAKRFWG